MDKRGTGKVFSNFKKTYKHIEPENISMDEVMEPILKNELTPLYPECH